MTEDSTTATHTTLSTSLSYETPKSQQSSHIAQETELDLTSLSISPSQSTPRPAKPSKQTHPETTTSFADYPSPYEVLRQEIGKPPAPPIASPSNLKTPEKPTVVVNQSKDIAMKPDSSPFLPAPTSIPRPSTVRKKTDPLLHRVLDRNYRVQATPLVTGRYSAIQRPTRPTTTASTATPATRTFKPLFDSSPESSPEIAPPKLHAEIFSSPARKPTARIPGVSVLTPAKAKRKGDMKEHIWHSNEGSDDDNEEGDSDIPFGQSPPKTMQFYVPQNRLLKTPGECPLADLYESPKG